MRKQQIAKLCGRIGGLKNAFQWHRLSLEDYLIERHRLLKEIERRRKDDK